MKYDQTFARFARRMIRQTAVTAGIFAIAGTMYWNWRVGAGVVAGGLFQILFLSFLLAKEQQWERQEKDPVFISQRLSLFAMCRLVLQILTCVAVVFTPLNIFGYLVGLLTLTLMTLVDKVVKLIKE